MIDRHEIGAMTTKDNKKTKSSSEAKGLNRRTCASWRYINYLDNEAEKRLTMPTIFNAQDKSKTPALVVYA